MRSRRIGHFIRTLASLLALIALTWPGVAPVRAALAQVDVSLAHGWEHFPTVAPGLVFDTGAYNGEQIVAGGPGLVAYEEQGGGFRMYGSATGQDWKQLPGPALGSGENVQQLFVVGQRFIIAGDTPSPTGFVPHVWASANGGKTWQESPASLQITAVILGGDGIIAFAFARSPTQSLVSQLWTSATGVTWRQIPDANGAFASGYVNAAAPGGPGYVAGGFISDAGGHGHATVWTSPDGRIWTEVPDAGRIFGSATTISQVVAGPAGIAAMSEVDGTGRDGIWASRDGTHWQRAADGFITTPPLASLPLAVWRGGFAEVQDVGTGAELYSSPDGLSWTRMGSDDLFGGSAWVTAMIGFHGGLAAIGGYAPHPRAHCLPDVSAAPYRLGTLKPSVFLWTPEASQTASAPTIDPTDPRALRLLPQDVPFSVFAGGPLGQYVNLCAFLPALGPHRAYLLRFGVGARGLALDIVTQRTTAKAAFRQVDRLVAQVPWETAVEQTVKVQRMRELRVTAHIGNETRAFTIHVKDYECGDLDRTAADFGRLRCTTDYYSASVVAWRHGRVIGMVVTDHGQSFAMALARKLHLRSQHPSD